MHVEHRYHLLWPACRLVPSPEYVSQSFRSCVVCLFEHMRSRHPTHEPSSHLPSVWFVCPTRFPTRQFVVSTLGPPRHAHSSIARSPSGGGESEEEETVPWRIWSRWKSMK